MGFNFASALTPHYFAKQIDDEILYGYYCRVADQSPIPTLLYNAPRFTGGVALSADCIVRLAAHGNIAGMKDSSSAGPGVVLAKLGDTAAGGPGSHQGSPVKAAEFSVLAGSANFLFPSLLLGAAGGVVSVANFIPDLCAGIHRLYMEGSYKEAGALHRRVPVGHQPREGTGRAG